MNQDLMHTLEQITGEEQEILDGRTQVRKTLYTAGSDFTIDSRKMLEKGRLIDVRTHTRFIDFPRHISSTMATGLRWRPAICCL